MPIYTDPFDVNEAGTIPGQERDLAVTAAVLTTNVATLTVPTGHSVKVSQRVSVNIFDTIFNTAAGATVSVTAVTATTISFALTHANVTQENTEGYVSLWPSVGPLSPWAYEGAVQQYAVVNAVLLTNVVTLTTSSVHALRKGQSVEVNVSNVLYNGTFLVTAVTNTTFTYASVQANIGTAAVTGYVFSDSASSGTAYQASVVDTERVGQSATSAGDPAQYSSGLGISTTTPGPAPVGSEKNEPNYGLGNAFGGPVTDTTGASGQTGTLATTPTSTYSAAVNDFDTTVGGGYVPGQVVANPVYVAPKPYGVPGSIVDTLRPGTSATGAGDSSQYSTGLATPAAPTTANVAGNVDLPNVAQVQAPGLSLLAASAGVPGAPGTPVGVPGRGGINISFTAASAVTNAPLRGYVVESATLGSLHVPITSHSADVVNISWATAGNTATVTTALGHNFLVGDTVVIAGVTVNAGFFNGSFTVATVSAPRTFTYVKAGGVVASVSTAVGSVTDAQTPQVFFDYVTPDRPQPLNPDGTVNVNGWAGEKFRVAAYNINGQGLWSAYSTAVQGYDAEEKDYTNPGGVWMEYRVNPVYRPNGTVMPGTGGTPSPPLTITVAATSTTAQTVSWLAPTYGAVGITHYWVQRYSAAGVAISAAVDAGTSLSSPSFTGLTAGTSYRYSVYAINAAGTGETSALTAAVSPPGLADAPTSPVAAAGTTTTATVTWTAPVVNAVADAAITGYIVTAFVGVTTTVLRTQTYGNVLTSGANGFTGLTPAQTYTFKVAAITASGTGPNSVVSNTITSV